ncbi:MAG TPA: NnrS family protein [Burkholderiales bacterium]|nr:NnrS family protein [Burkholderiales bacterium]
MNSVTGKNASAPTDARGTPLTTLGTSASAGTAPRAFALWQLGFRPFYLLASVFAALFIALWAAQYAGWLRASYLPGPLWHAHEMLYGYTLAVITGFLFTAVRNWTNRPTPTGGWLMATAALWVAGRILILTPYAWLSAAANAAFPLAVAAGIGIPLFQSHNRRNYFFVALLIVIALAVLYVHLTQLLGWSMPAWVGIQVALDVVLFVMSVMGGRVIPMFTANAIPEAKPRRYRAVERISLGAVLLLLVVDALQLEGPWLVAVLAVAASSHIVRWWLWVPYRTLRNPLVWVLHAAYVWIPIHLALRIAAALDLVAAPLAAHALTVGAIGGLTIGMMTRTTKGHTGRALVADAADVTCYSLVLAAAVVRVFGPMLLPELYVGCVLVSAACWSAGFGLFAVRYWSPLTRARIDGKPG